MSTATLADVKNVCDAAGQQAKLHVADNDQHPQDLQLSGIGISSQDLPEGALFAALPGTRVHGAIFAAATQAAAILTDSRGVELLQEAGETRPILEVEDVRAILGHVSAEIYGNPSKDLVVIGVTGTSGKTTTCFLLEAGLKAAGATVGLIGTAGTRVDGKPIKTSLTTPEAPVLHSVFAQMRDAGATHIVMEVSSHAIALGRAQGVDFDIAGFTNLSQDHLDYHPTMEDYFETKARFFLDPDSVLVEASGNNAATALAPHARDHVICVDDEWGMKLCDIVPSAATVTTTAQIPLAGTLAQTVQSRPTFGVSEITSNDAGVQSFNFEVTATAVSHSVRLPIPGRYNVANAALALGIASRLGVDLPAFIDGLGRVAVPGRMESIDEGQDFVAVVDYAHKPAAVAAVLSGLRSQTDKRVAIVIGAGGDRDSSKRPLMGAEAARQADLVIITDDNPRSEDPATIRAAVREGAEAEAVRSGAEVVEYADRRDAIHAAIYWAAPGDIVVVAGKGHETGQIVGAVTYPFDDRQEVRDAIRARLGL